MQKMHKTPTPVAASHERVSDASGRVWESMKSLSTGRVLNVTTDPETGVETLHKYVWPFKNKKRRLAQEAICDLRGMLPS